MIDRLFESVDYAKKTSKNRKQLLYFIQCNEFTKIGIAWDVRERLMLLRIGCPYHMEVIRVLSPKDAFLTEQHLHARFGKFHVHGEWFKLPPHYVSRITAAGKRNGNLPDVSRKPRSENKNAPLRTIKSNLRRSKIAIRRRAINPKPLFAQSKYWASVQKRAEQINNALTSAK